MTLVRPARAADAAAVRDVHVTAIERRGPEAYDGEQVAAWADRGDENEELDGVEDPDVYVVVAERTGQTGSDREIVGFGRLDLDESEVVAVYVHPDHSGAGVGSAILAHLEGYARANDVEALTLWSSLNAVGFYERAGYERVREAAHETTTGVELTCVVMQKGLAGTQARRE